MVQLNELENTLWGIVLSGTTRYEHTSERPIHISMASLDTSVDSDEFVPVVVEKSSTTKFIMCTLNKPHVLQQPIELELNSGENVTFYLGSKKGSVHLTGYFLVENSEPSEEELAMMAAEHGEHVHGPGCSHDDDEEDDDDDEDEDDEDEDDMDDSELDEEDEENGLMGEDDDDDDDDEEEDDDEDEDGEDEDDDDEQELNGNKRKQPITEPPSKKKKDAEEKAPKLVPNEQAKKQEPAKETTKTLAGGITVTDLRMGHGPEAKPGKVLSVYYAGRLKQNGKQFDSLTSGKPFTFRLGKGDVIKGWDIGMQGMKVGGKRTLTVPPAMGYGNRKTGPIPPNSTLIFDVELKAVN